jgi:phosphatidylglycerol:prolipoprotein diacylglycerol transferase
MLPVLYKFSFETLVDQVVLVLAALALVAYAVYAGWRGAHGPRNEKTGEYAPPTRKDQQKRALTFGAVGLGLAGVGMWYALPPALLPGAKGEGIPIHTYGLMLVGGFLAAVMVSGALAQKEWRGETGELRREQVMDLALYVLAAGLIGSRLLFIVVNWDTYSRNPASIFSLGGGLVFQGGLLAAIGVSWWFTRRNGIQFLRLGDIAMPTVSLGAAFGRLGCWSAGCCWGDIAPQGYAFAAHFPGVKLAQNLFGQVSGFGSLAAQSQATDPKWVVPATGQILNAPAEGAVQISRWVSENGHTLGIYPTQIFDSVGNFALFFGLLVLRRYRRFHGQILGMWLMAYAVLRSSVELFRGDTERGTLHGLLNWAGMGSLAEQVPMTAWYNISTGQFISMCMFAAGAAILWKKGREAFASRNGDLGTPAVAA